MTTLFDVLIVGYGPAGATAANLLGKRGYTVAVIDQSPVIYDKPRAITADQEVMRVFQECGLAEAIEPTTVPHPGTDFVGVEGQVIKRFYPQPPPNQLGWEPTWMFVQPELEATLRQGVARFDQVQVMLAHELLRLEPRSDDVLAHVKRLEDGEEVTLRAKYVIAADGARSGVRQHMGATIEDLAFDEWWIVVDAWLHGPLTLPPRCVQYCRPSRPGTYIVGPGDLRRWEIKLLPGEKPDDFQDETAVRRVLSEFVDVAPLSLCRTAVYRFHALVVEQWRFGRVFLMGDAAHQMPPFLGQGLCAAIRDAANLVWKIDAVERLGCTPNLLDTYGEERTPHVRTIVSHAKAFGLIIGELDEQAARIRDAELEALLQSGQAETVRQKFIPGLVSGLLDMDPVSGVLGRGAGALFVQPWVRAEAQPWQRLDDVVQPGFLLACVSPEVLTWWDTQTRVLWDRLQGQNLSILPPAALLEGLHADPGTVVERDTVFADAMAGFQAKAVLVRPDHHVYGVIQGAADLRRLVHQLYNALFPQG